MKIMMILVLLLLTIQADTISQIKNEHKLRIGIKYDTPPFGYLEKKRISGFDMALSKQIIEQIRLKLSIGKLDIFYKKVYPSNREQKLLDHKVDMVIATYTVTKERKKLIDFTVPYFTTNVAILYRGKAIPQKVGYLRGSMSEKHLKNHTKVPYKNYHEMYDALLRGTVDAIASDKEILEYFQKAHSGLNLSVLPVKSDYAIGVRKGDESFLKLLNEIITDFKQNSTLAELREKFIGK